MLSDLPADQLHLYFKMDSPKNPKTKQNQTQTNLSTSTPSTPSTPSPLSTPFTLSPPLPSQMTCLHL